MDTVYNLSYISYPLGLSTIFNEISEKVPEAPERKASTRPSVSLPKDNPFFGDLSTYLGLF
jgi:hypothetical protein